MNTLTEYRMSERRLLTPGTRFTARGGPVYQLADGTTVPLSSRGPFEFVAFVRGDSYDYIQARDRDGCSAVLHLTGDRRTVSPEILGRPYVLGKVFRKKPGRK